MSASSLRISSRFHKIILKLTDLHNLRRDELGKLGTDLYSHDLSSMLDAALRCTNAQYDDPEILNHLDVVVQTPYPGDCGWDVISLQYTVRGPLATMLEPAMPTYKTLFKPLWRMKHMEFVLSTKIWKEQMGNAKVRYAYFNIQT